MNEDERHNRGRFMECEREPWPVTPDAGLMACGCRRDDDVCLAGSAEACHARQMAIAAEKRQRKALGLVAQAWADDIDRRAFDHAWGVLFGARAANESRVCSGRERLGE